MSAPLSTTPGASSRSARTTASPSRSSGAARAAASGLEVVDSHLDEQFEFHVSGAHALVAFHHPFVCATESSASCDLDSRRDPRLAPERKPV